MFYIPCRLPMPNKKQGLFHTILRTFSYMQLLEPEVYSPAPEAPAHMQVYPPYIHPAISSTEEFFQAASHEYPHSLASLIDPPRVAQEPFFFQVYPPPPGRPMCF